MAIGIADEVDLASSYRQVEQIARVRARNFYYAFVLLPAEKRRALCAIYAFMRHCDDITDGDSSENEKHESLRRWRSQLESALNGDCRGSPIFPAFLDSAARFSIPRQCFHWMLDGVEMDLTVRNYETFDDLYRYCFHVAGSVGLTCLHVFGFRDQIAQRYAEECGIAFQLTNILRDVKEDASLGRVYLPLEDLRRFDYSWKDLTLGIRDDRFHRLMTFQAERARGYYDRARALLTLIDRESRPALWAMMEIYSRLLKKIAQSGYDVFGKVIRLSPLEKCSIAARALAMHLLPVGTARGTGTPRQEDPGGGE